MFIIAYLDNVLIYTNRTLEEYKEHVWKVLKKLEEFRLLVHPNKSEFYIIITKFLGFIISYNRIVINLKKTNVVLD